MSNQTRTIAITFLILGTIIGGVATHFGVPIITSWFKPKPTFIPNTSITETKKGYVEEIVWYDFSGIKTIQLSAYEYIEIGPWFACTNQDEVDDFIHEFKTNNSVQWSVVSEWVHISYYFKSTKISTFYIIDSNDKRTDINIIGSIDTKSTWPIIIANPNDHPLNISVNVVGFIEMTLRAPVA